MCRSITSLSFDKYMTVFAFRILKSETINIVTVGHGTLGPGQAPGTTSRTVCACSTAT